MFSKESDTAFPRSSWEASAFPKETTQSETFSFEAEDTALKFPTGQFHGSGSKDPAETPTPGPDVEFATGLSGGQEDNALRNTFMKIYKDIKTDKDSKDTRPFSDLTTLSGSSASTSWSETGQIVNHTGNWEYPFTYPTQMGPCGFETSHTKGGTDYAPHLGILGSHNPIQMYEISCECEYCSREKPHTENQQQEPILP
ncbi:unnamed protein product, partial [Cyprideis torosa]